jgi:hypothetical protein
MSLLTVGSVRRLRTVGRMMTSFSRGSRRSWKWVRSGAWIRSVHSLRTSPATPTSWSPSSDSQDLWCLSQLAMRAVSQWQDSCSNLWVGSHEPAVPCHWQCSACGLRLPLAASARPPGRGTALVGVPGTTNKKRPEASWGSQVSSIRSHRRRPASLLCVA